MYKSKISGKVATAESRIVTLTSGEPLPSGLSGRTLERWLSIGIIEKISSPSFATETKPLIAPETKADDLSDPEDCDKAPARRGRKKKEA